MKGVFMRAMLVGLMMAAGAAAAQTPLSGVEFDAYTRGKTLSYASNGQPYGVEQYLSDRRVRWAFVDDTCRIGHWYEEAENICFVYEHDATPQCWIFYLNEGRLMARFLSDPPQTELVEISQTPAPLACAGPDVGV
jgi:hypothetical protein